MPKLGSIFKFVSGGSERGNDAPAFRVTSRGGLSVDPSTLFRNSKVRETVARAAEADVGSPSPTPPTSSD